VARRGKKRERNLDPFLRDVLESDGLEDCFFQVDSLLHHIYPDSAPASTAEQEMLKVCLHDSVRRYGEKQRNLGGYFANHPLEVAVVLGAEGAEPVTVAAGLYHDVPEEGVSRLRKEYVRHAEACYRALHGAAIRHEEVKQLRQAGRQTFEQAESNLIRGYLDELQKLLRQAFRARGVQPRSADAFLRTLLDTVALVTRTHDQTYYQAMSRSTVSGVWRRLLKGQQSIDRAIAVKFADRLTNSLDLSKDYRVRRRRNRNRDKVVQITERRLRQAFRAGGEAMRERLEQDFRQNHDYHPAKGERGYRGSEKLYQFYKNIVLVQVARSHRRLRKRGLKETSAYRMVYREGGLEERLLDVNLQELNDIIQHLLTFHVRPTVAAKVLEQFTEYDAAGGLRRATKAGGASKFDGIIERFFDTRLGGNKQALAHLYRNKQGMLRAALGFRRLSELYKTDEQFSFEGVGPSGLKAEERKTG